MKKPILKPNRFIKVLYVDETRNSAVFQTVCFTHAEYRQIDENRWWKSGYWINEKTGNGIARHLNRFGTILDWSSVISWDYVDFESLK